MVNGSFVFGMDGDDPDVFDRTVDWAVAQGIETATFHILTPYPGTGLLHAHGRRRAACTTRDWDLYDTRHVVYRPARLTPAELEAGYWRAYRDFYRWGSIVAGRGDTSRLARTACATSPTPGGWKKFEPLWDMVIRARRVTRLLPLLEAVLAEWGRKPSQPTPTNIPATETVPLGGT